MRLTAAAAFVALGSVSATVAQELDATSPAASDPMFYIQLLGGANIGLDATLYLGSSFNTLDKTWYGYAQAATAGVNVWDGFSLEVDVARAVRKEGVGLNTYATTSFMANLKYTLMFDANYGVYAAAGVGYIWAEHFRGPPYNQTFTPSTAGYQAIGGVVINFTENFGVIGEARFQDTFENYQLGGPGSPNLDLPTFLAVTGVKVSF